jgi:hypothetical protein
MKKLAAAITKRYSLSSALGFRLSGCDVVLDFNHKKSNAHKQKRQYHHQKKQQPN